MILDRRVYRDNKMNRNMWQHGGGVRGLAIGESDRHKFV